MTAPGSAVIVGNSADYRLLDIAPNQRIICTLNALAVATPPPDRLLGAFGNTTEVDALITKAVALGTRVFCYHDAPEIFPQSALKKLRTWDVPLVECYVSSAPWPGFWEIQVSHLLYDWPNLCGFVWQDYTMNGTVSIDTLLSFQPFISHLVALSPRVVFAGLFAWNRLDAATSNPPIAEVVTRIAAASPGPATFLPIGVPPVQKRTILIRLRDGLFAQTNFAGDRSVTSGPQNPESVWTPTVLSPSGLWDVGATVVVDCAGLPFNPWDVYPDAINVPSPIKTPIRTATLWQIGRGENGIGWSLQTEATLGMVYRPDQPTRPLTLDNQHNYPASVWSFDAIDAITGEVLQSPF